MRSLKHYMFHCFVDTTDTFINKLEELRVQESIDMFDMFNRLTLEAFTLSLVMTKYLYYMFFLFFFKKKEKHMRHFELSFVCLNYNSLKHNRFHLCCCVS